MRRDRGERARLGSVDRIVWCSGIDSGSCFKGFSLGSPCPDFLSALEDVSGIDKI